MSGILFYIYVLECVDNRYYIGKTSNPSFRIDQHNNGIGASWTQKYKPLKVIETIETKDALDEDKITKKYMMKFGIEFVRGGSYTKIELDDWMIKSLEHEFISATDICYKCKKKGHFAKECCLNNQFNIEQYLQDFDTIDKITSEILILESVYDKIIILNKKINDTNIQKYNMNDYNKIKTDYDKYNMLSNKRKLMIEQYKDRHTNSEIQNINLEIQLLDNKYLRAGDLFRNLSRVYDSAEKEVMQYKTHINNIYQIYFTHEKLYMESFENTEIKFYKINIFNLQQKKELKKLLEHNISEELLQQKLYGLYEKQIKILTINL